MLRRLLRLMACHLLGLWRATSSYVQLRSSSKAVISEVLNNGSSMVVESAWLTTLGAPTYQAFVVVTYPVPHVS